MMTQYFRIDGMKAADDRISHAHVGVLKTVFTP